MATRRKRTVKPKSKGLGDTIEKITEATGIKKAVEMFSEATGVDCGCDKRKQWLNEKFSYKVRNCMTKTEYDLYTKFLKERKENYYSKEQVFNLINMHSRIFGIRPKVCTNCNGAMKVMDDVSNNLLNVYNSYERESTTATEGE